MTTLAPLAFHFADILTAIRSGWTVFRAIPGPSLTLGILFALIGTGFLMVPFAIGAPLLTLILAGGFALIGPLLLPPFFALRQSHAAGQRPRPGLAWRGYQEAGVGFWALAGACFFLLLVWITDAGILYAFTVGAGASLVEVSEATDGSWVTTDAGAFILGSSLLGAFLAAGIHVIAAFAIPLLYEGRAQPIHAVHASVRAMFQNPGSALAWGLIIILGLLAGLLLPPLLALVLPVLAYANFDLYRAVFPPPSAHAGQAGASPPAGA